MKGNVVIHVKGFMSNLILDFKKIRENYFTHFGCKSVEALEEGINYSFKRKDPKGTIQRTLVNL